MAHQHPHPTHQTDPARFVSEVARQLAGAGDVGYFGPDSAMWLINREVVVGLGFARAVLMQLAHPWVAQAIVDHSSWETQPLDRLLATAMAAEVLVFGSRAQADATAARIRKIHMRVRGTLPEDVGRWKKGTPYRADDPEALLWVLATLLDTALVVYEACFGRLPARTVAAYLQDGARLGELLGVPRELVPPDRRALSRYIEAMVDDGTVAVSRAGVRLGRDMLRLRLRARPRTFWTLYNSSTVAIGIVALPEKLRRQYRIGLHPLDRQLYRGLSLAGRLVLPRLPEKLRVDPITRQAMTRLGST